MKFKLGILATHPIQYFSPWYQALAAHPEIDLTVYYAHRQTPEAQAEAGFAVPFEWDRPLLEGYRHHFTEKIAEVIQREKFDAFLVSGWHALCFWQAIIACWRTGTPVLVRGDSQLQTARSPMKRIVKALFYRWFIPRFDGYLIVGRRAKEYLLHYGASEKKMFSVPHAVDNHFFAESSAAFRRQRDQCRREWDLPLEGVVFLFAGKLVERKRPMDLLKAIQAAGAGFAGYALIAGDGPLRSRLERFAKANHLPVRFAGFLNQTALPKAYGAADALVLPSDASETWGLVVNEAMASGLAVVVSDEVGCVPDLVFSGRTGETYPGGNFRALGAVLSGLTANSETLHKMGKAARNHVSGYSIEKATEGMAEAVRQIAKCRRK